MRETDVTSLLAAIFDLGREPGVTLRFQFVFVCPDGRTEPIWIQVTEYGVRLCKEVLDADVSLRINKDVFIKAVQDGRSLLSIELEQLFMAKKIMVDGRAVLAQRFFQLAHQWQTGIARVGSSAGVSRNQTKGRLPDRRRPSEVLAEQQPPVFAIERRSGIDRQEFTEKYLLLGRPVIVTEATARWSHIWSNPQELATALESFQGFARRGDYVSAAFSDQRDFVSVPLGEFVKRIDHSIVDQESLPEYVGNNLLPEELYNLIEFPVFFDRAQYAPPRLWIGPMGTVTPLHRDPNDNLFVQLLGRKRFVIAAPDQSKYLYCWSSAMPGLDGTDVDPDRPAYDHYPLSKHARLLTLEIGPGELLFIPEGWFHYVRSLSSSLSVSFWLANSRRR